MKDISALTPRDATVAELLLALAARCEAEEPSKELDGAIAVHLGWRQNRNLPSCWMEATSSKLFAHPPRYTTSLDAAVTLLPTAKEWHLGVAEAKFAAGIYHPGERHASWRSEGAPKTAALALCAAALRARAALAEQSREPMQSGEANPPPQGSAP